MRDRLLAALLSGCAGCGLLLDVDPEPTVVQGDAGANRDGSAMDGARLDGRVRFDATAGDAPPDNPDGARADAISGVDAHAPVDAPVGPAECAEVLAAATEIGPGMMGSDTTCSTIDLVDFDCLPTTGTEEAYYYLDATTEVTVSLSALGEYFFSRVDPKDCSIVSCGHTVLPLAAEGRVYLVVEHGVTGGCGATYSISAVSGWP